MAKVMISLPDEFLRKVDRTTRNQGRSRSELIRESLRTTINGKNKRRQSWKKALAPFRDLEQHWVGQWNSSDIIRYYRDNRYGRENRH